MRQLSDPPMRHLSAATLIAALVLAGPLAATASEAVPASPLRLAQANTAPPNAAPAKPRSRPSITDRVEARIKSLHDQLKITPDQEAQWNGVAEAMRDDAKAMQAMIAERQQNRSSMTAVDDLRSYQKVAETHVQGLQKLIPVFQALYDTMSPDQKKNADAVFAQRGRHRGAARKQQ